MSKIEWTEKTWNPVTGCTKISPGCAHCYAETMAKRLKAMGNQRYKNGFEVTLHWDKLEEPYSWKKPRMVFVNSMSDLFHKDVPDGFLSDIFETMEECDRHTFQILTKRADRLNDWLCSNVDSQSAGSIKNVWLGVSIENRRFGLDRLEYLRRTPAAVRFLSCEPLLEDLGPLDLTGIDWVIVGGESGSGARSFDLRWARKIRDQCKEQGVPFFLKQVGARPYDSFYAAGATDQRLYLKSRKGGDPEEWPADLRVREMPKAFLA